MVITYTRIIHLILFTMMFTIKGHATHKYYEEKFYNDLWHEYEKVNVVTAHREVKDPPEELEIAQRILDRQYEDYMDKDNYKDDYPVEEVTNIFFSNDEQNKKIIQKHFKAIATSSLKQPLQSDQIFTILHRTQLIEEIITKKAQEITEKHIWEQQELSQKSFFDFFNQLDKKNFDPKTLYILVIHEAFFNYFNNPAKLGNFIPFSEKHSLEIIEYLHAQTKQYPNILFILNLVSLYPKDALEGYKEHMTHFAGHSFKQKKILGRYDKILGDGKFNPIKNESFLFFRGDNLLKCQKQYILDEDIPNIFFETDRRKSNQDIINPLYVPGLLLNKNADYLKIEICQDHQEFTSQHSYNLLLTRILVVQSASIDLRNNFLKEKGYTGLVIHADCDNDKTAVMMYVKGESRTITATIRNDNHDLNDNVKLKYWDISTEKSKLLTK